MVIFLVLNILQRNEQEPQSDQDRTTLIKFHDQLKTSQYQLQNLSYIEGYGNITGFHLSYQDLLDGKNSSQWPIHHYSIENPWKEQEQDSILPNQVSDKVKNFWSINPVADEYSEAYLLNISGSAYGEFTRETDTSLKSYPFALPDYLQQYFDWYTQGKYEEDKQRYENDPENNDPPQPPDDSQNNDKEGNVTVSSGKISIDFDNYDYNFKNRQLSHYIHNQSDEIHNAVIAKAKLKFKSYDESELYEFDTTGVYFQDTGSMISTTNSAKFMAIYALNHLTMNENSFNTSKILMNQFLKTTNIDRDVGLEDMNQYIIKAVDHCEIVSYIQFKKTKYIKSQLQQIDQELKYPTGIPLPNDIPLLEIENFLVYSPDCGIILQKKTGIEFTGIKSEILSKHLKYVLIGLLCIISIQLALYLRQIKVTRTPGQLSIISIKTLYLLGYQDSLITLMSLFLFTFLDSLYLLLVSIAVISFIMCGIFELRFMVAVLSTQINERGSSWWEILRGGTRVTEEGRETGEENERNSGNNTPEAAVTTPEDPTPTYNEESSFNGIFAAGFILTVLSTFLIFNSFLWRKKYRIIFEYIGLVLINSYWIPQFFRNTLKNRRKSFTWEFVIFTSLLRIIPIAYFGLIRSNPLRHHYDPYLVATVLSWLFLQIFLLYLQSRLGPRFWVNEKWLPKAYNYQPVLTLKDLEAGFVSDILEGIKLESENNGIVETSCTCPICMNTLPLPVVVKDEARKNVNSKGYMITPCHHIFHTECLENWMKYKLQCPVCRHSLPPV